MKLIKNNIRIIIGIIIGIVVSATTVYATNTLFDASQISYFIRQYAPLSNASSKIDELYEKTSNCGIKNNKIYFEFGEPTEISTRDYTTLEHKVFIAKNGNNKAVCIVKDNRLHCFDKNGGWKVEGAHLKQVFGDSKCNETYGMTIRCELNEFICYFSFDEEPQCIYSGTDASETCIVKKDGTASCSTRKKTS